MLLYVYYLYHVYMCIHIYIYIYICMICIWLLPTRLAAAGHVREIAFGEFWSL